MSSLAARAAAAVVAFSVALTVYAATASFVPLWPPSHQPTSAELWLLDAIARVPLGDPLSRAIGVAVLLGASTAVVTTLICTRLGYSLVLAAASAITLACSAAVWQQATTDVAGALASLLIACAIAIVCSSRGSRGARTAAAAVLVLLAITLGALRIDAISIVPRDVTTSAMQLVRAEWLLPPTALIAAGMLASLWGAARGPTIAIAGTGIAILLAILGADIAVFAPFAAIMMAHGLTTLPAVGVLARVAIAIVVASTMITYRYQLPHLPVWQLTAWRDAVERSVPPNTVIATSDRAAAALHHPLFAARPARIKLQLEREDSAAGFVLDDLRSAQRSKVTLAFASPLDAIRRLPTQTIVGFAMTSPMIADHPELANEVLAALGHPPVSDASVGAVAIGVSGDPTRSSPFIRHDSSQLLLGDPIGRSGLRSPADLDLRVTSAGAWIRLRGRDVLSTDGWAAIALDRYGTVLAAFSSDAADGTWPIDIDGLNLWK
jgi:hypothetical protein